MHAVTTQKLFFPAPGETGFSLDWGTVVGFEGFKFGEGALAVPRPPTPGEFPVVPVPAALPPPVPPLAPLLCANAAATKLNVRRALSARTLSFGFTISSSVVGVVKKETMQRGSRSCIRARHVRMLLGFQLSEQNWSSEGMKRLRDRCRSVSSPVSTGKAGRTRPCLRASMPLGRRCHIPPFGKQTSLAKPNWCPKGTSFVVSPLVVEWFRHGFTAVSAWFRVVPPGWFGAPDYGCG